MHLSCRRFFLILFLLAVLIGIYFLKSFYDSQVGVPAYKPMDNVVTLGQGWDHGNIEWYNHTTQGSTFSLKTEWFLALEQPVFAFDPESSLFRRPDYLGRFGFLFDTHEASKKDNYPNAKLDLPVGFTEDRDFVDPMTQQRMSVIGLSCAACHTGQLNYKGTGVRIVGGQSMANFIKFQNALGLAMLFTYYDPLRFERFATRVLGKDHKAESKAQLKKELHAAMEASVSKQMALDKKYPVITEEGFGRLDALNRIGNFVFGLELYEGNTRNVDAPVTFPYLWGMSWLDWVQYNGSVMQPMTRNAGEALGVFAPINLTDLSQTLFQSSLTVQYLYVFEQLLGGTKPFEGLKAPEWPSEIFGAIDQDKAAKGKVLYREKCATCHLPPVDSNEICHQDYWTKPNEWNKRFLKVTMVNVDLLGTDSQEVMDWARRTVETKQLGLGVVKAEQGLPLTVENATKLKYDAMGFDQAKRDEYNGYRPNKVRAPLCYKARSLEGIWATPPYLHNGSVPNLYQLLSPVAERDRTFYLTSQEFDPKNVGYSTEYVYQGFKLDTDHVGNHNNGHEFRDLGLEEKKDWNGTYPFRGVLGPVLAISERWELVEYLKTLKSRDLSKQTAECPAAILPDDQKQPIPVEVYPGKGGVDTCQ